MDVRLEVMQGSQRTRVIHLRADEVTIGRKRGSNLRIPAATVSRQHCQLTFQDECLIVEDFDSFNGTYVNGKRVRKRAQVLSGDRLKIGPITFLVKYGADEPEEVYEAVPLSRVFEIGDSVDLSQDFGAALPLSEIGDTSSASRRPVDKRRVQPPPVPELDDQE